MEKYTLNFKALILLSIMIVQPVENITMPICPTLQRLLNRLYASGFGNLHQMPLTQIRTFLTHPKLPIKHVPYQDFTTAKELSVRVYTPSQTRNACHGAIIFLSASAFIIDRKEASNDYCSLLAEKTNMKVFNIIQRLPPDYRFPDCVYDALTSLKWIYQHAKELNIFKNKLVLWGESSGGSIAASINHLLRDEGLDIIQHQILFYPLLDLVTPYPSRQEFAYGYMLDETFIHWLYDLMSCDVEQRKTPLASPLLAHHFTDLPSTTLISAHYDPLRDEGEAYIQKLKAAGVSAMEKRYPDMIHGFMRFYGKISAASDALNFACARLRETCAVSLS